MPRPKESFQQSAARIINENNKIFTGIVAASIVVMGIVIVQNPTKWWIAALVLLGLSLLLFLFVNGRVVLKALVAVVALCICGDYGFRIGTVADSSGKWGVFWFMTLLALWMLCLAVSYFSPSLSSRWIILTLLPMTHFLTVVVFQAFGASVALSLWMAIPINLIIFLLLYYVPTYFRKSRRFPKPNDNVFSEKFVNGVLDAGWGAWHRQFRDFDTLVVWNDSVAYQLVSITLENKLASQTKWRRTYLTHRGQNINASLFTLARKVNLNIGLQNPDAMLIVLDAKNRNGTKEKVYGIKIPDTQKKAPVGILPANKIINENKPENLLNRLAPFEEYAARLNERQLTALDSQLPVSEVPDENLDEATEKQADESTENSGTITSAKN